MLFSVQHTPPDHFTSDRLFGDQDTRIKDLAQMDKEHFESEIYFSNSNRRSVRAINPLLGYIQYEMRLIFGLSQSRLQDR